MAHDVFISYADEDRTAANAICATLEAQKIRCWMAPRDVTPGMNYGGEIIRGINGSSLMVLVHSSRANASRFVMREVERAVSRGIPIMPLRIEAVMPSEDLEFFLGAVHWLDAYPPPVEQHLRSFAEKVRLLLPHERGAETGEAQANAGQRTGEAGYVERVHGSAEGSASTAFSPAPSQASAKRRVGIAWVAVAAALFLATAGAALSALVFSDAFRAPSRDARADVNSVRRESEPEAGVPATAVPDRKEEVEKQKGDGATTVAVEHEKLVPKELDARKSAEKGYLEKDGGRAKDATKDDGLRSDAKDTSSVTTPGAKSANLKEAAAPAAAAAPREGGKPVVIMDTSMGMITIELEKEKTPTTVENFLKYVDAGFYENLIFHRVIGTFMIQGGGYNEKLEEKTDGQRGQIKNESGNGLSNLRGTVAMARRTDPNSAQNQFFINVVDNKQLDTLSGGYTVFGTVIDGMDVVDKIKNVATGPRGVMQDVPLSTVTIKSVKRKAKE